MAPDADNLATVPGEIVDRVRGQLPIIAGLLALSVAPAILGAGPAALITSILAVLHKVGGPVMKTAQRANIIFQLKRWFRLAWNANHRPENIKAANAEFVGLVSAIVLLMIGGKADKDGGNLRAERTTLPATLPETQPTAIAKQLAAASVRPLIIDQTYETVKDNVLHVNGTPVPAMAGGSQTLDQQDSIATYSALSPSHEARDNEADPEIRYLYNKVINYFDNHAIDAADANVYEEYMREYVYGSHDNVSSVEDAVNAVWYIPELDWMAAELELRINGSIGLLGDSPSERRPGSKPSMQRAKDALERIKEIRNKQKMTLGEYRRIIADHHQAFGYDKDRREYPLDRRKPYRPILERRRRRSYRQINDPYTVGAGPVEIISTEYGYADGFKFDKRSYPIHDTAHYFIRPEMPNQAEAFLRHASRNIDFYMGFEHVRDERPPEEQELLDVLWFDLSREGKDGFWPRELNPVSFALALDDEKSVCAQVLERFSAAGNYAYRLEQSKPPSLTEIKAGIKLIREYVDGFMANATNTDKRLLEFHRELAQLTGSANDFQPEWMREFEHRIRRFTEKRYWEPLTPEDYRKGYQEFGDQLQGAYGALTPAEKRQIDSLLDLTARYVRDNPSKRVKRTQVARPSR